MGVEIHKENINSSVTTGSLMFSPALSIGTVDNSDGWTLRQGYPTNFTANLVSLGATALFNTVRVAHILDIDSNILMSYQAPSVTTSFGTEICDGYMKTVSIFNGNYYTSLPSGCSRYPSSNILIEPTS